jgi:hypothetical protein
MGYGSVTGYNVYRKVAGEVWDFSRPINASVVNSGLRTYVDNGINSRSAPVPNTVYIYEVRPILSVLGESDLEVSTNTPVRNPRIMAPPDNMVFAHRWMLNKKTCEILHSEPYINQNYFCEYVGPQDSTVDIKPATAEELAVFDIGKDLLVQRFEMGCPYSQDGCNTATGQCADERAPKLDGSDTGMFFYDRSTGYCHYNDDDADDTDWVALGDGWDGTNPPVALGNEAYSAHLPPWVRMQRDGAVASCTSVAKPSAIVGLNGGMTTSDFSLPKRFQQIAYSHWDITSTFNDSDAAVLEEGLALNSRSKCNSSNASGLEYAFTDGALPDSNTFFSLPGASSSSIRSLYTGSDITQDCESFVGVQDTIGNVGEYSLDTMTWASATNSFTSTFSGSVNNGTVVEDVGLPALSTGLSAATIDFDGSFGACYDVAQDGTCDGDMMSLTLENKVAFGHDAFWSVIGMPVSLTFMNLANEAAVSFQTSKDVELFSTLPIGNTDGITAEQLRDDQQHYLTTNWNADGLYSVTSGGSYFNDGDGAGVFALELIPATGESPDWVGSRCIIEIDPTSEYTE